MLQTRLRENTIGQGIYERIKEYDLVSRKVFLNKLPEEHRKLYEKYKNMINKRKSLNNDGNRERQNKLAKEGMKNIRATRTSEEIKEQRKPYDAKYQEKKKLSKEEAARIIQTRYRAKKNKKENEKIARDIIGEIINNVPNYKIVDGEVKKKRGRKIQ